MDVATIRTRLEGEGIDFESLSDGTLVASVTKPREEFWKETLLRRVAALPGVVVTSSRELPSAAPSQTRTVVRFVVGSAGMVGLGTGRGAAWRS